MEVITERRGAGDRLEDVAMRERQPRLTRRLSGVGADVEVDAHLLHGAWRRVVEGEILHVARLVFTFGHPDTDPELSFSVLAIPDVAEIGVFFAGEEEGVGWRKRRQ